MEKKQVCWVEYWTPGFIVGESFTEDLGDHLPEPGEIKWPKEAYCFNLYQREDLLEEGKTFKGEAKQVGHTYYHPDSKVESLEEVKRNPKATDVLIKNMEGNKWSHIVWSRWGNWPQVFKKTDEVLGRTLNHSQKLNDDPLRVRRPVSL